MKLNKQMRSVVVGVLLWIAATFSLLDSIADLHLRAVPLVPSGFIGFLAGIFLAAAMTGRWRLAAVWCGVGCWIVPRAIDHLVLWRPGLSTTALPFLISALCGAAPLVLAETRARRDSLSLPARHHWAWLPLVASASIVLSPNTTLTNGHLFVLASWYAIMLLIGWRKECLTTNVLVKIAIGGLLLWLLCHTLFVDAFEFSPLYFLFAPFVFRPQAWRKRQWIGVAVGAIGTALITTLADREFTIARIIAAVGLWCMIYGQAFVAEDSSARVRASAA